MKTILCLAALLLLGACNSPLGPSEPSIPVEYELTVAWVWYGPPSDSLLRFCWTPYELPGGCTAALVFSTTASSMTRSNWAEDWCSYEPIFFDIPPSVWVEEPYTTEEWDGWAAMVVWEDWNDTGILECPDMRSNVVVVPDP